MQHNYNLALCEFIFIRSDWLFSSVKQINHAKMKILMILFLVEVQFAVISCSRNSTSNLKITVQTNHSMFENPTGMWHPFGYLQKCVELCYVQRQWMNKLYS